MGLDQCLRRTGTGSPWLTTGFYAVPALLGVADTEGVGVSLSLQGAAWKTDGSVFGWGAGAAHYVDPSISPMNAALVGLPVPTLIPGFSIH